MAAVKKKRSRAYWRTYYDRVGRAKRGHTKRGTKPATGVVNATSKMKSLDG